MAVVMAFVICVIVRVGLAFLIGRRIRRFRLGVVFECVGSAQRFRLPGVISAPT